MIVAWGIVALYLLIGAFSLRLIGRGAASRDEPLWLLPETGLSVTFSILIAVGEEILFRDILQSFCITLLPAVYAFFLVNALFAAIHAKGGLTFAVLAGFFGFIASVVTLANDSLLPAIAMHVGWNLLVALARHRARSLAAEGA